MKTKLNEKNTCSTIIDIIWDIVVLCNVVRRLITCLQVKQKRFPKFILITLQPLIHFVLNLNHICNSFYEEKDDENPFRNLVKQNIIK